MKEKLTKWRKAFEAASSEVSKTQRKRLSVEARRLMQERLVAIANGGQSREERAIEKALRVLWAIEHKTATPKRVKRKRPAAKGKR